jgi:CelD/BcsL family acetyltransferase involved in cellulose biosynthesis
MHQSLDGRSVRSPNLILTPDDPSLPVAEWDALTESVGGSYFQSGTWAVTWWELLAGRPETHIALWTHGGRLEAVCAVSAVTRPLLKGAGPSVKVWVNMGSGVGAADHLGWPGYGLHGRAMLEWVISSTSGPVVLSNLSPAATAGLTEHGFRRIEESPTLAVDLGHGEDWFPGSNDFRKKLRYAERQLGKAGISISMVPAPDIDTSLFRRLLELHAVRSEGMGWESNFDRDREAFHLGLIDRAVDGRGPMACVARTAEEVVGILYGFRFGSTFAYYQTGWSQEHIRHSLGSVLVARTMQHAASTGATRFDFLRGDDAYKRRFGAEPFADETWSLERGIGGAAVGLRRKAVEVVKARRR